MKVMVSGVFISLYFVAYQVIGIEAKMFTRLNES
jgi:hypothetical protein